MTGEFAYLWPVAQLSFMVMAAVTGIYVKKHNQFTFAETISALIGARKYEKNALTLLLIVVTICVPVTILLVGNEVRL